MIRDFIIWGAGGHGKVVADIVRAQFGDDVPIAYADRDAERVGDVAEPGGAHVEWQQDKLFITAEAGKLGHSLVLAVGSNPARLAVYRRLAGHVDLPVVCHPSAVISPSAELGEGTQVCPRVVVHPLARVGAAVILNTACVVEHDCVIGDAVHVSPGAILAGEVTVGEGSWIGAGAVVINGVKIGDNVTVGAGAVVIRDVPAGVTVVGNPARILPAKGG